jgi:hypothetical protein
MQRRATKPQIRREQIHQSFQSVLGRFSVPSNRTTYSTTIAGAGVEAGLVLAMTGRYRPRSSVLANRDPITHTFTSAVSGGIMSAVRSRNFQFGLMLATALSVSMWPAASEAYTPEQQAACSDDAFRLCGADIPDVDRVTACMVRKQDQLSPGCRVYFRPSEPEPAVRAGMPLSIKPAASRKPVSERQ